MWTVKYFFYGACYVFSCNSQENDFQYIVYLLTARKNWNVIYKLRNKITLEWNLRLLVVNEWRFLHFYLMQKNEMKKKIVLQKATCSQICSYSPFPIYSFIFLHICQIMSHSQSLKRKKRNEKV